MKWLIWLGLAFFFSVIVLGISAFMGWLTMIALAAFGFHMSFWVSWVIYIVLSAIFGRVTTSDV